MLNGNNIESELSIPNIPISVGELFDKYTILKIKSEKIKDKFKLKNVQKELILLENYVSNYKLDPILITKLENINRKLWNIEDNIRLKEKQKEFDKEFIEIARSVYINNDIRAELKNNINILLNSDIVEVKNYTTY